MEVIHFYYLVNQNDYPALHPNVYNSATLHPLERQASNIPTPRQHQCELQTNVNLNNDSASEAKPDKSLENQYCYYIVITVLTATTELHMSTRFLLLGGKFTFVPDYLKIYISYF